MDVNIAVTRKARLEATTVEVDATTAAVVTFVTALTTVSKIPLQQLSHLL